jgi:hypothetical protein
MLLYFRNYQQEDFELINEVVVPWYVYGDRLLCYCLCWSENNSRKWFLLNSSQNIFSTIAKYVINFLHLAVKL